jgi:hypothetical protein
VNAGTTQQTANLATIAAGYSGSVTLPATTSGSGQATLDLTASNPTSANVQSSARMPQAIGGASLTPLVFVTLTSAVNLTFPSWPAFTFALPSGLGVQASNLYVAWYNPANAGAGWTTLAGPATALGNGVYTFAAAPGPVTFTAGTTYAFVLFSTTSVLVVPTPTPTPTATPTPSHTPTPTPAPTATPTSSPTPTPTPSATAVASAAYTCPTSGTAGTASLWSRPFGFYPPTDAARRVEMRHLPAAAAATRLAVTYDRPAALANTAALAARERQLGARLVQSYDFRRQNAYMRVISVAPGTAQAVAATLRGQSGVRSVAITGGRRYPLTTTPYYPNDPYFDGFGLSKEVLPYATTASVPGQWDMHAIGLEHAFGYSQSGNGSGIVNANALGSANIKIAIIDTGEDANHAELMSKIAYQHCVITDPNGDPPSTGNFSTDEFGHGTDVSGIAAAATNNSFGFTGAGGNAVIYAYRVFPTPDDSCTSDLTADNQCSADSDDIGTSILDAINQGVNVISMSLGGGSCGTGPGFAPNGDADPLEGMAIQEAIDANIIVVAAAGNAGGLGLDSPACDNGVIAVGATGLDDGTTTGTTGAYTTSAVNGASSSHPIEYVANYSQYGSTNMYESATSWGIVAPGADPNETTDQNPNLPVDNLHWVENIWTTTPLDSMFGGPCRTDYPGLSPTGNVDCRIQIAGTSMATPHVAGAIALILAVKPAYQNATAMKSLLCSTADNLGDSHQGCGRLNVYRAMAHALGDQNPP